MIEGQHYPSITQSRLFPYRIVKVVDYMDIFPTIASEEDHSSALTAEKSVTKLPIALNDDAMKQGTIPNYSFASSAVKQAIRLIDVPHCYDNRSNPSQDYPHSSLARHLAFSELFNLKSGILER